MQNSNVSLHVRTLAMILLQLFICIRQYPLNGVMAHSVVCVFLLVLLFLSFVNLGQHISLFSCLESNNLLQKKGCLPYASVQYLTHKHL